MGMGNRRGIRLGLPRNRRGFRLGLPRLVRQRKSELESRRRENRNLPIVVEEEESSGSDEESICSSSAAVNSDLSKEGVGAHVDSKSNKEHQSRKPTRDEQTRDSLDIREVEMNSQTSSDDDFSDDDASVSSCHSTDGLCNVDIRTSSADDGGFSAQGLATSVSSRLGTSSLNKYNGSLLSPSTDGSGGVAAPNFGCVTPLSCSVATSDVLGTVRSEAAILSNHDESLSSSSNLSERQQRARQLKEKVQVLLEVAHQKSLSGSFSAISSRNETERDSVLTSVKSLQNLENDPSLSYSASWYTSANDENERKCSDPSSFESEETITSELMSIREPHMGSLNRPLFLDSMGSVSFSSRLTQELLDDDETQNSMMLTMVSTALSSWSTDTNDPKCCDQLLRVDSEKPLHLTDYLIQWRDQILL